jgi:hypothetical protein
MNKRKPKFCPFREKPCRDDCMHYESNFSGGRFCTRDSCYLIMREMIPAFQDVASAIREVRERKEKENDHPKP